MGSGCLNLIQMILYGTTYCTKTLKARHWLEKNLIVFEFYDIRKNGLSFDKIREWDQKAGYKNFLVMRNRSWTDLYPRQKEQVKIPDFALSLMYKKPGIIKRPVIECAEAVYFGFDEDLLTSIFHPR